MRLFIKSLSNTEVMINLAKYIFTLLITILYLNGCSLFGNDDVPAEIQFVIQNISTDNISITAVDSKNQLNLSENDFSGTKGNHLYVSTATYQTATDGKMEITFSIENQNLELSTGEFEIELKEDWRWGVNFQLGTSEYNPMNNCLGCQSYESFGINPEALTETENQADSLYVVFGGNYISEPVIY